jgi:hypothetical protein
MQASAVTIKWLAPAPNSTTLITDTPPETNLDRTHMQELQILSMPNSEYAGLNSVRVYRMVYI